MKSLFRPLLNFVFHGIALGDSIARKCWIGSGAQQKTRAINAPIISARAGVVCGLLVMFAIGAFAQRNSEPEQKTHQTPRTFELHAISSDAISITLRWQPQEAASEYEVSRDGKVVGRTSAKVGYFTDFDLVPEHIYQYRVTAANSSGAPVSFSESLIARTGKSAAIRTQYTVLAIAFGPPNSPLVKENAFLKHRIQFLKLASLGSADIKLYHGGIVQSPVTPALGPGETTVDYKDLVTRRDLGLNGYSIIDLIEKGDIDHVWVVKTPVEFLEDALVGNRTIQGPGITTANTWVPISVKCSRSFFVNQFTPDERANDAYTHMVEGIMTSISDGHPESWPRNLPYTVYTADRSSYTTRSALLNLWEKFRLADEWNGPSQVAYASKGNGNVGSSHFPPTSPRTCEDYCYFDRPTWQRYIDSAADDWLGYPSFGGAARKLNGYDFGAFNDFTVNTPSYSNELGTSPELHPSFKFAAASFHQWWFAHIPHNAGVQGGVLNDWWPYLFDFNRFDGVPIDFDVRKFGNRDFTHHAWRSEASRNPPEDVSQWGYWNSQNGFSPGAKVGYLRIVSKRDAPGLGIGDPSVLSVTVENTQELEELGFGRNDVFYPVSRNAHWSLQNLRRIDFAVKPYLNPQLIVGTNPVVRLHKNGGQRIEFVPRVRGVYANLFDNKQLQGPGGWFRFSIPMAGDDVWEKHVIGYIDPALSQSAKQAAQEALQAEILEDVNYVEISIRTATSRSTNPDDFVTYYIGGPSFK